MKTLYPAQEEACAFFESRIRQGVSTLDSSELGTGKTVVACQLAARLGRPVGVIAPKATLAAWRRELQDAGVEPLFVLNYEKLRTGNTPWLSKKYKKVMTWHLPEDTLLIFDEVHNCKGPMTQNAQLMICATMQGFLSHSLSATASEDPTEMRATGYAWGCHSLNDRASKLPTWVRWMKSYGCTRNPWRQWEPGPPRMLRGLHDELYGRMAHKVRVGDLPSAFLENLIDDNPIDFPSDVSIGDYYDELGITPEIVETFLETGKLPDNQNALVDMLRARQLAEAAKLPYVGEMVQEALDMGRSVVVFMNFNDSIAVLRRMFPDSGLIVGEFEGRGQKPEERQAVIDAFARDEVRVVLANIRAGGTGVSLHDQRGEFQRVTLISPTFSAKDFKQVLGRVHRNGMRSPAYQRVLVAAGTVEETVLRIVRRKINNLEILHGK